MIAPLVDVVQLALAGAAFAGLVFLVSRSALAGAGLVLVAFVLFAATSPPLVEGLVFPLGGVAIYPLDITSLALLAVGVWRLFTEELYGPARIALVIVTTYFLASLAWGAVEFGAQHATNYARLWLLVVSGLVYGATVRSWDRRLPTLLIATGCFLAALGIVQILRRGLHEAETQILIDGKQVDARPVIAMGVLVMLQGLVLLFARGRFTFATASLALLLASGIALVQFRTLWVATFAAAVLGAFYLSVRYRAHNERVVYTLTGMALLIVPVLLIAVSQVGTYQDSVRSSTGDESTLTWRIGAWQALLDRHSSAANLLLGTPSGTEREVVVLGEATNRSAHNVYVEALVSFGLIGFLALCALAYLALSHREQSARRLEVAASAVVVLIVCDAIVALTNQPDQVQGLLFGALLSAACYQTQSIRGPTHARPAGLASAWR